MKKIMVVDDEKEQIYSIEKFFNNFYGDNYQIISARSGKKCLKLLEKEIPDIIILDIMMPEMNGWEVIEELKKHPSYLKIPVIILTARTDGFARDAGKMMADDFIAKPIDYEELRIRIDKVLKKK
jgi:CheY-like chemotaxis protein